jgi:hypothetical protein
MIVFDILFCMKLELPPRQMDEEGNLGPVKDICLVVAERVFRQRWGKDTNPCIVQMILDGRPQQHWYYRSDQWLDQPFEFMSLFIQAYRGEVLMAYPWLYGEDTYSIDQEETQRIIKQLSQK